MRALRKLIFILLLTASLAAGAASTGSATVYGGLTWSVSTGVSGLTACNQLMLDASGDFVNRDSFVLYGAYNCPSLGGGYPATGVGYIGTDGLFNMTVTFSNGWQIGCVYLSAATFSGSCNVYNNLGVVVGPATVNFIR